MPELRTLMSGLVFSEQPRWHENRLWFSGTAAHIPPTGTVTVLLSKVEMAGPTPPALRRDVWRHAASA